MKKFLCFAISIILLSSCVIFSGCGKKTDETVRFGIGVYAYYSSLKDASEDADGTGKTVCTVAAILVDSNGKISDCKIDVAENTVGFTLDGKYVSAGTFKTKTEAGDSYNMKGQSSIGKEWYEQVGAFANVVKGKTLDEVKALVAGDGKGNEEVINAGCTISVSDFVKALEKAFANLSDSYAYTGCSLGLGISSEQKDSKNATEESDGVNAVDVMITASVTDKDGKVIDMRCDSLQSKIAFSANGKVTTDLSSKIETKRELGDDYGMKKYGNDRNGDGKVGEWYEQADAFLKLCIGKTSSEISALAASDGYGIEELQTAGCTIAVSEFIKSALKSIG